MLSALLCAAIGFYLRRPITASRGEDRGFSLRLLTLGAKSLALLWFLTITLLGIQLLSWMKTGSLSNPDPITLLIGSFTGNYFHDPLTIKRNLAHLIGLTWLAILALTMRVLMMEQNPI